MTRFWIGAGILAALLVSSLLFGAGMERLNAELSDQLSQAAEQVLEGNWEEANLLSEKAFQSWNQHRKFAASLADHEPLEEMDRLFDQLQVYRQQRMATKYAELCRMLSRQAEAMGENSNLTWWNFW